MKSYTLTQISGSNYTVYLDGAILTAAQFKTAFLDNAGTAEFTSSVATSGVTLWDSAEMTGNSISTTEAIEANTPYNGAWAAVTGVTTNTFTSFTEAKGKGLTDYQLSVLAKIAKEGKITEIEVTSTSQLTGSTYVLSENTKPGFYRIYGDLSSSSTTWTLQFGPRGAITNQHSNSFYSHDWLVYVGSGDVNEAQSNRKPLVITLLDQNYTGFMQVTRLSSSAKPYSVTQTIPIPGVPSTLFNSGFGFVIDELTKNYTDRALSANQGRVLNNAIAALNSKVKNFTGTDGTDAGTAGLVPAPATTDADKFLKSDGTWDSVSGGLAPTTTFWGQTASNGAVSGNIQMPLTNNTMDYIFQATDSSNAVYLGFYEGNSVSIGRSTSQNSQTVLVHLGNTPTTFIGSELVMGHRNQSDSFKISRLADPTNAQDAATKNYVDTLVGDIETALNTINNGGN